MLRRLGTPKPSRAQARPLTTAQAASVSSTAMKLTHALVLSLDAETTGTDTSQDRIVELGGVYMQAGAQVGPVLRALVDPKKYIPAKATQIHGIRNEDVEGQPQWPVLAARLAVHFDAGPVLCGYNFLEFDGPLIDAENARQGIEWRVPRCLDPFRWTYWGDRGMTSRKLGAVCEHYGVELPEDRAHTADADALATGQLLMAMVLEGVIPDDVEQAFVEQDRISAFIAREFQRFGRFLYEDRGDGTIRVGLGKHCGSPLAEVDDGYLKWLLGRPEMPDEARSVIRQALGQVEQIGLF